MAGAFSSAFSSAFDSGGGAPPAADVVHYAEYTFGPPLPGSPWGLSVPHPAVGQGNFKGEAPSAPTSADYGPGFTFGPSIPGAPWVRFPHTAPDNQGSIEPVPAPVPTNPPWDDGFTFGPPIPGAPWATQFHTSGQAGWGGQPPAAPGTPGGEETAAAILDFVPRVLLREFKNLDSPQARRRLERFTEKVSMMLNSLISQGQVVQTGIDDYEVRIDDGEWN